MPCIYFLILSVLTNLVLKNVIIFRMSTKESSKLQALIQDKQDVIDKKEKLLQERTHQLTLANKEISSLQNSMFYLLATHNQSKITSVTVNSAARIFLLNEEIGSLRPHFLKFPEIQPVLNGDCTAQTIQDLLLPILNRWSHALALTQMLPDTPTFRWNKARPLPGFANFHSYFNTETLCLKPEAVDLLALFDTRLRDPKLRQDIKPFATTFKFTDILDAYMTVVACLLTFHRLAPESLCLRYPRESPTVINYENEEEYQLHVITPNSAHTRTIKRAAETAELVFNISDQQQRKKRSL